MVEVTKLKDGYFAVTLNGATVAQRAFKKDTIVIVKQIKKGGLNAALKIIDADYKTAKQALGK